VKCSHTFRPFKKKRRVDKRWLESYLLDGSSFRRLAQRWGVCHMTAWNRIQRTQNAGVNVGKLIIVLPLSKKVAVLMLDVKHFRIRRKPYSLYIAMNGLSGRPLAWILLPRYELRDGYDIILRHLRAKRVNIEAVVSDWHHGILASLHDYYPNAIHQRCAAHVLMDAFRKLGGKKFLMTGRGKEIWPVFRRIALGFNNKKSAGMYLGRMKKKYPRYYKGFKVLTKCLDDIYQFEKSSELNIPRTSNRIENFIGVLEQRLKTFRGTKTPGTTIRIITSYILIKYKKPTK